VQLDGVRAPTVSGTMAAPKSGDALRQRYDAARVEAVRQQVGRYVDAAKGALERNDYASAANAYRIAASLAPNDTSLQSACAETAKLAATALADGFWKQAEYEARNERWGDAALSYAKVCSGRPDDAKAHERAAFAAVQAGGNPRRAVEFARRAVELAPKVAGYHVTLALAYLAAGLDKSAKGEIDRALELGREDPEIRELVTGLRDRALKDGKVV
jgi:Flp pilus assembly protein TadD